MNAKESLISEFKSWTINLKLSQVSFGTNDDPFSVFFGDVQLGWIVPFTSLDISDEGKILLLSNWRNENREFFLNSNEVNFESTKEWLDCNVIKNELRELFWVVDLGKHYVGHIGVAFDEENSYIELDSILRGTSNVPGLMKHSIISLERIIARSLKVNRLYLRVLSQNDRAIKFYQHLGYQIQTKTKLNVKSEESSAPKRINIMHKEIRVET